MENKNYREIYNNLTIQELENMITSLKGNLRTIRYKMAVLKDFNSDEYEQLQNQLKEVRHKIAYSKFLLLESQKEEDKNEYKRK